MQQKQIGDLKLQIQTKEKEIILDELMLKQLAGLGPEAEFVLTYEDTSSVKPPLPSTLGLDLLAQRPDLLAQLFRVEAARQEIGVAKTEFYPNVNLVSLAGLSSLSFGNLFTWASRVGTLHPAINLPVFTGGKLTGNLKSKLALFNEAVFQYNETLLQAAQEVTSEITTYLSLTEQLKIQENQILLQEDLLTIANSRFIKGIDRFIPTLQSEVKVLEEKLYEVSLKEYRALSFVKLIKALGGGKQEDEWTK